MVSSIFASPKAGWLRRLVQALPGKRARKAAEQLVTETEAPPARIPPASPDTREG